MTIRSLPPELNKANLSLYAGLKGFKGEAALGAALAIGFGTQAQAAAPANYSRACTEIVASNGFVQKTATAAQSVRRSGRRTSRRHSSY
jgi:hypothetical protein